MAKDHSTTTRTTVVIVSGLSGAGKTVALQALEDCGFYCVDHLPSDVLHTTLVSLRAKGVPNIAIGLDPWDRGFLSQAAAEWRTAAEQGFDVRVLVLEAKPDVLRRRYSETRRPHPLARNGRTVEAAIALERRFLRNVPDNMHRIDTSDMAAATLKHWVKTFLDLRHAQLSVTLTSFGFKQGTPMDADIMFDVRCLPNPYYNVALRPLSGLDTEVKEFFAPSEIVSRMIGDVTRFITNWAPEYEKDHRSYLTVAIGCTGGQHRSVHVAQEVGRALSAAGMDVNVRHREINRWRKPAVV
jgi:UPF0042 nucleotide-binding protein